MINQSMKLRSLKILLSICFALSLSSVAIANDLNLNVAKQVIQAAEKYGKIKGWKLSIAVVNAEGNLIVFQRGDGTYAGSINSTIKKAKSANAFQRLTSAFAQAAKDGRVGILSAPEIVAIEGGVPLTFKDKHVGAIGVSGAKATEDEEAAIAASNSLK